MAETHKLIAILGKGHFLENLEYPWLDPFLEKLGNTLVGTCVAAMKRLHIEKHEEMIYDLANIVNYYDDLNENALSFKLRVLLQQGKLSIARSVYDKFGALYNQVYGEAYALSFEEISTTIEIE